MTRVMKDSGVEWIGLIPESWSICKTGKLFRNIKEIVKEKSSITERLALTLNGVIKRSKSDAEGLQPEQFNSYQYLRKNQLVFKLIDLENVNTSRVGLCPFEEGMVSPAYIVLKNNQTDNRFYHYYFLSLWHNEIFNHLGGDGVRSALNVKDLLGIPTFSIDAIEQQAIADYLDEKCGKIDSVIESQKKIIEKLKEYKQSVITEAVTKGLAPNVPMKDSGIEWIGLIPKHWEVRKVKTLTKIISKGTTPTTVGRDTVKDGPVKFIKAENIQNNQIQNEPHIAIDEETNEILKRSQLKLNDILFVIAGATIGKVAIIDNPQILPANTNQAVSFLRLNNPNLSKYLWYYLQSNYIKEKLHVLSVQSAQPNLSMQDLGNFCIPIPKLIEQHCIITHLSTQCAKIDLAIQQKEETITKLEEYKKSLIYECVTGKKEIV